MDISAVTTSTLQSLHPNDITAEINTPDVNDIEVFKQMMANSQPTPEANFVSEIQSQQKIYTNAIAKINAATDMDVINGNKDMGAMDLLNTQYKLFDLSFTLDLTAKAAGQLSQAVNKLTTMQ